MKRRKFIKKIIGVMGAGALTGIYSYAIEPFWLDFVKLEMPIPHLPKELEGKILMQISDMHIGDRFDRSFIVESFKKAQAFSPDIVVYTGDFSNYRSPIQLPQLDEVFASCVKGSLGTFGVLGNHDYGHNWSESKVADKITEILNKHGVDILRNEKRTINGLDVIGLDDYWSTNFHPSKVMNSYIPDTPSVALCHNPDVADLDIWNGYKGWILAGHTHGGQCKPPFLPPPMLPVKNKKYSEGRIDLLDGRIMYINRALGHLHQVRFNVRPEITLFTLKKA